MLNRITKSLSMSAIALSSFFLTCNRVGALPTINYQDDLGQVTNVNQLRDVSPTDWAYEALRSLVDRYGCIVGFPNQTYRGSTPITRYEFAAGLNSCLNQIERLVASSESIIREDLDTLERLITEFEAELAMLGSRVDNLESRTAFLEDNAFSTTTKLNAQIVNYLLGTFGDEKPDGSDVDDQITFSSRIRLNFDSSFSGQDRLRVRLQARNITSPAEAGGTNALALNFDGSDDNDVKLNDLYYVFPVGDRITVLAGTNGVDVDEIFQVAPTMGLAYDNLTFANSLNPLIYGNGISGGAGVGATVELVDWANIDIGYWANDPANSEEGSGLFNGNYAAGANLNLAFLDERLNVSLAYLRGYQGEGSGYDLAGFVGTEAATDPFEDRANSSDNFGVATSFRLIERLSIGGFFGYTTASTIDDNAEADIMAWSAYASFSDLLKEGSAFLVTFGQTPTLVDSEGDALDDDEDSPYLLSLEYQYKLTDNIQITPGGYVLFNPEGDSDNDNIYVGTIRTIFSF
ncbi:MAG: iron uptake porin [Xenococcaceae cyanobacterium MO_188.B29]|nr:iron uptake porin [Xenococcaceae cyanobacterium MO_188.B29]